MSFDEFLDRRLAELLRFAIVLCGDPIRADELVADVLVRAYPHWNVLSVADRPFAAVRTAVVREFLGVGRAVGGRDVDARTEKLDTSSPADLSIDVAAFATGLSALPDRLRAALSLAVYCGQTEPEIAAELGRPLHAIRADIADAGAALDAATDPGDRVGLIDLFDELGDSFEVTAGPVASTVLDRLESSPQSDAAPAVFEAIFAISLSDSDVGAEHEQQPGDKTHGNVVPPSDEHWINVGVGPRSVAGPPPAGESPDALPEGGRARSRRTVAALGRPAAVAVVLVVIAVGVSLIVSAVRHDRSPRASAADSPHSAASVAVPRFGGNGSDTSPLGHQLPGTKLIGQYFGAGPRTFHLKRQTVGKGRVLAIDGVCSGPGGASIGPATLSDCNGVSVGTSVTSAQIRSLKVQSDPTTTWRFTIVDEPGHGTTGTLRYPVNPALTAGSPVLRVAQASGTGPASVALSSGTTSSRVENLHLVLTCKGGGVSFASPDHRFDAEYTRTCFQGWSYEFDIVSAVVPETLAVKAPQGTSWRLAVTRS